jgi:outer membrane protein assembly factor BamE (lipoprotein component of BamABCDE complex)
VHRIALPFALVALVACGGPKARIKDNQSVYDTYPPEVQAMIKSGQITQGFDQTQVYMALGKPEKKEMREGQDTWLYTVAVQRTLQHEKGAVQFENEQMKYEKALAEYNQAKAEGRVAIEPSKPDPYSYETQHRTKLRQEVVFVNGKVATARNPQDEYLDEWH